MGDRIVVMKDGFIQQVDTPQNLYDYPCNLFVGWLHRQPADELPGRHPDRRTATSYTVDLAGTNIPSARRKRLLTASWTLTSARP